MASKIEFKSAGFPIHSKQYWDQPWAKFRREWFSVFNAMVVAWQTNPYAAPGKPLYRQRITASPGEAAGKSSLRG